MGRGIDVLLWVCAWSPRAWRFLSQQPCLFLAFYDVADHRARAGTFAGPLIQVLKLVLFVFMFIHLVRSETLVLSLPRSIPTLDCCCRPPPPPPLSLSLPPLIFLGPLLICMRHEAPLCVQGLNQFHHRCSHRMRRCAARGTTWRAWRSTRTPCRWVFVHLSIFCLKPTGTCSTLSALTSRA